MGLFHFLLIKEMGCCLCVIKDEEKKTISATEPVATESGGLVKEVEKVVENAAVAYVESKV